MEGIPQPTSQQQPPQGQPLQQLPAEERLNPAVVQQLNLESVKTRALSLFKAISRIIEDFDAYSRTNTTPKWQDVLGQYSMVNMELFNIVDEIKKVSKAFVVHPKNVNAENATILPVMISSKLLPEMESEDSLKRDQLLMGMSNLPVPSQIEKLKARIDMISVACESAEKVLADTRKAYQFGARQGPTILPTLDKTQVAKIQEQENILRSSFNFGESLRLPVDQRQVTNGLPVHLSDVLAVSDGMHSFSDSSGLYAKNTPPLSNNIVNQGSILQGSGASLVGKSAASPSTVTSATSFDNATASPIPYVNSPRSGGNKMNSPSPQPQIPQQQTQMRPKMMPLHQQQLINQQQMRQSAMQTMGQNQLSQMHDMQTQNQQKFQQLQGQHQMQYMQPVGTQQFRQISGHIQQNQLNAGNQGNRHMGQFPGNANAALFNAAQGAQNSQMIPTMSVAMGSQTLMARNQVTQYGLSSGGNIQRTHPSQMLNDQVYNMGVSNPSSMMPIPPQQQQMLTNQASFANMAQNPQSLQPTMMAQNSQNLQPTMMAQNPQSLQPTMMAQNPQTLQPTMMTQNPQSLQPTMMVQNPQNLQPTMMGQNVQNLQPTMMGQNTQNLQPAMMGQNAQNLQPTMMGQNAQNFQPTMMGQNAQNLQPNMMPLQQNLPAYAQRPHQNQP